MDGGDASHQVAEFWRLVPIRLGGQSSNLVDAAIAKLLPGVAYEADICRVGSPRGTVATSEGMAVVKHGRTTGLTEGMIDDISITSLVGMDHADPIRCCIVR